MSPASEIESTEPSELIYVPNNSWGPIIVAAGLALLLVGLFKGWFIILVGVFILLLGLRSWWRLSNDEISRMRREQQTDTAVIPAEPVRRPSGSLTKQAGGRRRRRVQFAREPTGPRLPLG